MFLSLCLIKEVLCYKDISYGAVEKYLHRTMEKVQKPSSSEYYTTSSEPLESTSDYQLKKIFSDT
jgi:hypothetical protein